MGEIKIDYTFVSDVISEQEIKEMQSTVDACHKNLINGTGKGNDYVGWVDFSKNLAKEEIEDIKATAKKLSDSSDAFLSLGIGGSYLGAKAVIDALSHTFSNELAKDKKGSPNVYFAGQNLSSNYVCDLFDVIQDKKLSVNVISKSGTTTETALVFRIIKNYMEKTYGKDVTKDLIVATTDKSKGALKQLSDKEGYKTFVVPDDVGGRYSVQTPVGLLPIAVAGIDIDELLAGVNDMREKLVSNTQIFDNPAIAYAVIRNLLYRKGKILEILVNYEPCMHYFSEWWKQLYGESEGKGQQGIFPAAVDFTTDLHSLGQYIQDGERKLFETIIHFEKTRKEFPFAYMKEINIEKDSEKL